MFRYVRYLSVQGVNGLGSGIGYLQLESGLEARIGVPGLGSVSFCGLVMGPGFIYSVWV